MTCVALEQVDWLEAREGAADLTVEDLQREAFATAAALDTALYLALSADP
jgi:hypothetical protein